jgi:heme ABC exporter ATP-binding subunit CcmA
MSTPALDLHRVAKLYGRTAALRATSLRLEAGESLALLGPNGSGKTTLLKIIAGAIRPTLGTGTVFGLNIAADRFALRSIVGLLSSETYLYDDLTSAENLRFILTMAGQRPSPAAITDTLRTVDLLPSADERVRSYSSGMKRRLALARLLLLRPRLLLLDEPYNSLDVAGADLVDAIVHQAVAAGCAVVLATHDADRALALTTRVAALDRGSLAYDGTVAGYRMRHAQHVG